MILCIELNLETLTYIVFVVSLDCTAIAISLPQSLLILLVLTEAYYIVLIAMSSGVK